MPSASANRSKGIYWERPIKKINRSINQSTDRLNVQIQRKWSERRIISLSCCSDTRLIFKHLFWWKIINQYIPCLPELCRKRHVVHPATKSGQWSGKTDYHWCLCRRSPWKANPLRNASTIIQRVKNRVLLYWNRKQSAQASLLTWQRENQCTLKFSSANFSP